MARPSEVPVSNLIVVPAVISLGVTLLRLVGELNNWSPRLFSKAAGGAGALVGISWLIPVFGIYFAVRLARSGAGPASKGAAVGLSVAGLALMIASAVVGFKLGQTAGFVGVSLGAVLGALLAARGWPALGKVNFAYGIAARVPVMLVMLVAILNNWGTHYDVAPPDLPAMSPILKWVMIGVVPQAFLWIGFTVIAGGLAGSLVALAVRPRA